jgi:hypothetical protein
MHHFGAMQFLEEGFWGVSNRDHPQKPSKTTTDVSVKRNCTLNSKIQLEDSIDILYEGRTYSSGGIH